MNIFLTTFLTSLIIPLLITPMVMVLANKIGAVDRPNSNRKIHTKCTPRLGGLSIYISFIVTIALNYNILDNHLKGLLVGSLLIVACGILDDMKELTYKTKLVFQILAALMLIFNGISIDKISLFMSGSGKYIDLGALSIPITILWVVGVTNAINLIDGLDGLACGLSAISSIFLCIVSISTGNIPVALLLIIIAGASLGFLPYNFNPAKIFMGDTGSLFLGFSLAALSIQGTVKYATTIIVVIPLLTIGLPIYDTLVTIIRRFIQGKPIMAPDKQHFHHRMLSLGLSQKQVALLSYLINILLGFLAISIVFIKDVNIVFILGFIILLTSFIIVENFFYSKKITHENKKEH